MVDSQGTPGTKRTGGKPATAEASWQHGSSSMLTLLGVQQNLQRPSHHPAPRALEGVGLVVSTNRTGHCGLQQ